jgi:Pyridine nucleotide-disulphide oxidoreductase
MAKATSLPRIAVLGSGPIGLEAALYARTLNYPVTIYDAGQVAEHVNRWGHVTMFTPFGSNTTTLGMNAILRENPKREFARDDDAITGREWRESYLLPLAETPLLKDCFQLQTSILTIGRTGWRKTDPVEPNQVLPPFRLLVRTAQGQERFDTADRILDCTGSYSRPNWAGDAGIPAAGEIAARPQISYWIDDILGGKKAQYAGKSIILIGGGYSAATTMMNLATLASENQATWAVWLTHAPRGGGPLPRIPNDPLRERDKLALRANNFACRCDHHLEYYAMSFIEEIVSHGPEKGFRVAGQVNGKPMSWEVDRVIANVGYRPDMTLCQELRVSEPVGDILTNEPDYYVLGMKSQGRSANFILRTGYEQIRRVFALIAGKKSPDLYTQKAA